MPTGEQNGDDKSKDDALRRIEWMLTRKSFGETGRISSQELPFQPYGDLTTHNTTRLILDSAGPSLLSDIVREFLDLLETSCVVHEKNGDYALGIFSSDWCRLMDMASRQRCDTPDNREALASGRWHCHESCWNEAARRSIETGGHVDVECSGGIRLFAVPIRAGGEIVGSISVGYGDPPRDPTKLHELAVTYGVSLDELLKGAEAYETRPSFIIELTKKRVLSSAWLIGEVIERKRAEEALRRSEEAHRLLFEQSADGIVITAHRKIVKANRAFCTLCGMPVDRVIGMDPVDVIHPDDQYLAVRTIQTLEAGESVDASHVYRVLRQDGSVVWVEIQSKTIEWAGQLAIQSIVREITQRKRTEEALRESEAKFRQMVEYSPLPIAITTEAAMIEYVNPKFIETFGYILEEVAQLADWFRLAHPDAAYRQNVIERWQAFLEMAASENRPGEGLEVEITCQDGSVRTFEIYGTPMGDRTLALFNDLTERKLAEKALQEANETLRTLIQSAPVAIIAFGINGEVKLWNPAADRMFGWSEKEVFGQLLPCVTEGTLEEHGALRERVVRGESFTGVEVLCRRRDGSVIDVSISAAPLHDAQGKVTGVMSINLDISERKRAEEERGKLEAQMREVQKLETLGVLAGGIAHDFNNLLMAILGNADLALARLSPTAQARHNVEEIARASHRAADLCRQMLAYSGKGRFVVGRYDLSEIVREMAPMLEASVSKKANLRYSFVEDLPAVEADANQMRQVIMNLISNASEALGDMMGIISISSSVVECDRAYLAGSFLDDKLPEGRYVYLEVSDTGCGMDAQTMSKIFDPFFTTKFVGRGLGLAAVLGIVRGHKGAIKVYSEPGKGTTFKILLPAIDWAPEERAQIEEESDPAPRRGCVLLVDDDPDVRFVGSEMLDLLGFQVLTAVDGPEGLDVFRAHGGEINCVILDLTMPKMGGEEAFRELRRLRSDVCVILSSGYNEQDVTQLFVGKGLAGFIQKPYTAAKLRDTLNRVLG